jgi:hypothetical protein
MCRFDNPRHIANILLRADNLQLAASHKHLHARNRLADNNNIKHRIDDLDGSGLKER